MVIKTQLGMFNFRKQHWEGITHYSVLYNPTVRRALPIIV